MIYILFVSENLDIGLEETENHILKNNSIQRINIFRVRHLEYLSAIS